MSAPGCFYGIGVGPGEPGLIPVIAWETIQQCEVIFVPRARTMAYSVARRCLPPNDLPAERFREVEFAMDSDRSVLQEHYTQLAASIAMKLLAGKNVAYLTLGDPFTYSTYSYTLAALKDQLPELRYRTIPGVTSYCAVAAANDYPLGEGKERVLILPCPEEMDELRAAIESNGTVVLMKIGERLPAVIALVRDMGIEAHCAFGRRVGMPEEMLAYRELTADKSLGYLSTMLIRKQARANHSGGIQG